MAGKVFAKAQARMSVMWHFVVDHDTVGPAYAEMQKYFDGPATIAQDLTAFNITNDAIVARQTTANPVAWPVVGQSKTQGTPMNPPDAPPDWWADTILTD